MPYTELIEEGAYIAQGVVPAVWTPATTYGAVVDMEVYRRLAHIVNLGVMVTNATLTFTICEGATNTPTTETSKTVTFTEAGGDGSEVYTLEISAEELAAGSKYVRAKYVLGVANAAFGVVNVATQPRYKPA